MTAPAGAAVILNSDSWFIVLNILALSRDNFMGAIETAPTEEDAKADKEMYEDIEDVRERIICQLGEKKTMAFPTGKRGKPEDHEVWEYMGFCVTVTNKNKD